MTRTVVPKDRCPNAIRYGTGLATRCIGKVAHTSPGGKHEGKGLKKDPFRRIVWFGGDAREFITDKDSEFSWREKK